MLKMIVMSVKSALLALFLFCLSDSFSVADTLPVERLEITRLDGKTEQFDVEVADTDTERAIGLMDRETMAENQGMLFDFGETRMVYMWMKDTYLPLDMLFLAADGKVVDVKQNALPLSEAIIESRQPVRFVLEINGGLAGKKGVVEGVVATSPTITRVTKAP